MEVRAHMDGGAQVTTTDNLSLLWHYRLLPADYKPPALKVADNTAHYPIGYGYLKVPCLTGDGHKLILCFYKLCFLQPSCHLIALDAHKDARAITHSLSLILTR